MVSSKRSLRPSNHEGVLTGPNSRNSAGFRKSFAETPERNQSPDRKEVRERGLNFLAPSPRSDTPGHMLLTEIIFRLFARLRPLLWYYHRLRYLLAVAIHCLEDDAYCFWLHDNRKARASFEAKLVDAERCLEAALGLRVREILGLPIPISERIGLRGHTRIHSPASLIRIAARLDRLVDRYNDIERLAQLRAARLRREADAAPILLEADHRPGTAPASRRLVVSPFFVFPRVAACTPAGLRIRAPP